MSHLHALNDWSLDDLLLSSRAPSEATKTDKSYSALTLNVSGADFLRPKLVCLPIGGKACFVLFPVFVGHVLKSAGGTSVQRIGSLKNRGRWFKEKEMHFVSMPFSYLQVFLLQFKLKSQAQSWKLFEFILMNFKFYPPLSYLCLMWYMHMYTSGITIFNFMALTCTAEGPSSCARGGHLRSQLCPSPVRLEESNWV